MKSNSGKYFLIPDWLLQENSQTIHAYIFILNEINKNHGSFKTSLTDIAEKLNISKYKARYVLDKISTREQSDNWKIINNSTGKNSYLSIDFIAIKEGKTTIIQERSANNQSVKKTIAERKEKFIEDLKNFSNLYDKDLLNDFYRYWGETDVNEQKMRFEFQKTWNLNLRLITWKKNQDKKFKSELSSQTPKEETIGRTSIETIKKNAEYHGKY